MQFVFLCDEGFENVPKGHGSNAAFPVLSVTRTNPMRNIAPDKMAVSISRLRTALNE